MKTVKNPDDEEGKHGSTVSMVARIEAGRQGFGSRQEHLFSSLKVLDSACYPMDTVGSFPRGKVAGGEADSSLSNT